VQEVVGAGDPTRAAIGPLHAQELYGGHILARDIQDIRGNLTRFVALASDDASPTGNDKTSLGFTVKENVPGILFKVFQRFADHTVQLTKIESRPIKGRLGMYVFLLDFEGHRTDPVIAGILDELRGMLKELKVFGSYPAFPLEQFDNLYQTPALL
jgi:prephenate dehydratase